MNEGLCLKLVSLYEGNSTVLRRFIFYGIMGGISTGVDWGSYYCFLVFCNLNYLFSVAGAFVLGSVSNYLLNKHVTFQCKTDVTGIQISYFVTVSVFSLLMSFILMYLQVDIFGLRGGVCLGIRCEVIARMNTTLVMYVVNFILHSAFTFNAKRLQSARNLFTRNRV